MWWRIKVSFLRLWEFLYRWPYRLLRLVRWLLLLDYPVGRYALPRWLIGLFLMFIDLTPVPWLVETLFDFIKWKTRPLQADEINLINTYFQGSLQPQLIGIDPDSWFAKKNKTYAFVSFHTINFHQNIPACTFIHESVHVWQYHKWGSIYISEAIYAQHWGGGYNYGGNATLQAKAMTGLNAFNFEQQADIIEDHYRLHHGLPLQWSVHNPDLAADLHGYLADLV